MVVKIDAYQREAVFKPVIVDHVIMQFENTQPRRTARVLLCIKA